MARIVFTPEGQKPKKSATQDALEKQQIKHGLVMKVGHKASVAAQIVYELYRQAHGKVLVWSLRANAALIIALIVTVFLMAGCKESPDQATPVGMPSPSASASPAPEASTSPRPTASVTPKPSASASPVIPQMPCAKLVNGAPVTIPCTSGPTSTGSSTGTGTSSGTKPVDTTQFEPAVGYKGSNGFTRFVRQFLIDAKANGLSELRKEPYLPVTAANLNWIKFLTDAEWKAASRTPTMIGSCTYGDNASGWVEIQLTWWMAHADGSWQLQLMHHELGHCILGRGHKTDLIAGTTTPVSIMFPSILYPELFDKRKADYLKELFTLPGPITWGAMIVGMLPGQPEPEQRLLPGETINDTEASVFGHRE